MDLLDVFIDVVTVTMLLTAIIEMIVQFFFRKSTSLIIGPYLTLFKDTQYLISIMKKPRFSRFFGSRREDSGYIELEALEKSAGSYQDRPQALSLLLQRHLSLNRGRPIVLVGKPGSGKTTALEAAAFEIASRALKRQRMYLFILIFALLLSSGKLLSFLISLLICGLGYRYILRVITWIQCLKSWLQSRIPLPAKSDIPLLPIFIDARAYAGGSAKSLVL